MSSPPSDGSAPDEVVQSSAMDASRSSAPRSPLSQRIRTALRYLAPASSARPAGSLPTPGEPVPVFDLEPELVLDFESSRAISFRLPPPPPSPPGMPVSSHQSRAGVRDGPDTLWYPPGVLATIGPVKVEGGMIYVTSRPQHQTMTWFTSCAIDSSQPVSFAPDSMDGIGYYPSYDRLTPQQRGTYLRWLEGGRVNDFENQACLFLFFYGIERRVLADLDPTTGSDEIKLLYAEVAQLARRFSHRHSFWHFARSLLDLLDGLLVSLGVAPPERPENLGPVPFAVMPVMLQLELAAAAKHGLPVAPEVALAFVRAHHGAHLRTPARRCVEEFNALFLNRYVQRFPNGLLLGATSNGPLVLSYRPAARGPRWRSIVFHQSALGTTNPLGGTLDVEIMPAYADEVSLTISDLSPVLSAESFPRGAARHR